MKHDPEMIEALAESVRIAEHGLMRPFWTDMDEKYKMAWRSRALSISGGLDTRGWQIVAMDDGK